MGKSEREGLENEYRGLQVLAAMDDDDLLLSLTRHDETADRRLQAEADLRQQWAIIAPVFPRSERAREEINLFYFNELRYEVESKTGIWRKALIRDPFGAWADEPGFLLIDPDIHWTMDLARRCRQHVLVAGRVGQQARFIWLDSNPVRGFLGAR